jgi:hypothetical protein
MGLGRGDVETHLELNIDRIRLRVVEWLNGYTDELEQKVTEALIKNTEDIDIDAIIMAQVKMELQHVIQGAVREATRPAIDDFRATLTARLRPHVDDVLNSLLGDRGLE